MSIFPRAALPVIVGQHLEAAMHLHGTRQLLLDAPHARLHQLARLDERLLAHLDGLAIAGEAGLRTSDAALVAPFGGGELFVAAVLALLVGDTARLERLLALAEAVPDAAPALASAFGWVSSQHLRGVTKALLDSPSPLRRAIGLQACAAHQVDPGPALTAACDETDTTLRSIAWQASGQLGRVDLLPATLRALTDPDDAVRFEAARAAVRLGDRDAAPATLRGLAVAAGPHRVDALTTSLLVAAPGDVHGLLKALPADLVGERLRVRGAGWSGDPFYVPWLLKQAATPALARVAGEALSLITGADLAALDLEGNAPAGPAAGPNDDPADDDVSLDEDESLPWPDTERLAAWWQVNAARFAPGTRHFVGQVLSPVQAMAVLSTGMQRQRVLAADHLVMLQPGSRRFNTAAPSHRQQRLLATAQ
jgi:uncharacterized protein (TIGR02270 family)